MKMQFSRLPKLNRTFHILSKVLLKKTLMAPMLTSSMFVRRHSTMPKMTLWMMKLTLTSPWS